MNENEATERQIVLALLIHLEQAGFSAWAVDNGEEEIETPNHADVLEHVFSVDWSNIRFVRKENRSTRHWVMLVCGNGRDILSDWGNDNGPFTEAVEAFCDKLLKDEG